VQRGLGEKSGDLSRIIPIGFAGRESAGLEHGKVNIRLERHGIRVNVSSAHNVFTRTKTYLWQRMKNTGIIAQDCTLNGHCSGTLFAFTPACSSRSPAMRP